jgi:hypothetical protein
MADAMMPARPEGETPKVYRTTMIFRFQDLVIAAASGIYV